MAKLYAGISLGFVLLLGMGGAVLIASILFVVDEVTPPSYRVVLGDEPSVSAPAWLVFDVEYDEVLFSRDQSTVYPIASVTKLMTALALYHHTDLQATTTILWSDLNTDGDAGRLGYGEVYSTRELLFPLLLESSNDAAAALRRTYPELLTWMNAYAAELTMHNTHFADASGLSDENVSNLVDLIRLAHFLYQNHPHLVDISRVPAFYTADNGWLNNSPFLHMEGYSGGKHGFTYAANRTAVAFFEEEISGHTRTLGYILLGSDDLAADMRALRAHVVSHSSFR